MDKIGPWFSGGFEHLQQHWRKHLVPALVFNAAIMVVVGLMMVVIFAVTMLGGVLVALLADLMGDVGGLLGLVVMVGIMTVLMLALNLLFVPLQLGYMRGTINLMRGGDFTVGDLFGAVRLTGKGAIAMVLLMTAVMTAALFCYFPAFLVGALFMLTMPLIADPEKELGPIEAMKTSVELIKPHFWGAVLYMFLIGMLTGLLSYIPIVGPMLVLPIAMSLLMSPYLDLVDGPRAPAPPAHGAPGQVPPVGYTPSPYPDSNYDPNYPG
jgi:hypothetical protein